MDGWMDEEQQTGQSHHNEAWLGHHVRFFFPPQLVKVHDNTKATSQDLHLLIQQYRIYRIQYFFQARNLSKARVIS